MVKWNCNQDWNKKRKLKQLYWAEYSGW
jgi:hypothetical protein